MNLRNQRIGNFFNYCRNFDHGFLLVSRLDTKFEREDFNK
mgnify:CR=1 FL=1